MRCFKIEILLDNGLTEIMKFGIAEDEYENEFDLYYLKEMVDEWIIDNYDEVKSYQLIEMEEITLADFFDKEEEAE